MKKALGYGTALIAIYLVVSHGTNAGKVIGAGAKGGSQLVKTFQGR